MHAEFLLVKLSRNFCQCFRARPWVGASVAYVIAKGATDFREGGVNQPQRAEIDPYELDTLASPCAFQYTLHYEERWQCLIVSNSVRGKPCRCEEGGMDPWSIYGRSVYAFASFERRVEGRVAVAPGIALFFFSRRHTRARACTNLNFD